MARWHGLERHIRLYPRNAFRFRIGDIAEAMQVPFPELKYLELIPHDKGPSVLPDTFLDGIRPASANALVGFYFFNGHC
jgi:hypothetical protein